MTFKPSAGCYHHRRRRRDGRQPVALGPRVEHGYERRELVEDVEADEAAAGNLNGVFFPLRRAPGRPTARV